MIFAALICRLATWQERLVQRNLDGLRQPVKAQDQTARAGDGFFLRRLKEDESLATAIGFAQG